MKFRHYIVVIVLIPVLLLLRFVIDIGNKEPGVATVIRVFDGDTVELNSRETLRLSGIDTPEYGEPFFDSAKAFLADLVLNRPVRVELGFRKRDKYDRLLGYLFVDTVFINAEILKRGWGRMYLFPDNRYDQWVMDRLFVAQRKALDNNAGIWALPIIMEEEYYVGNTSSMRFHRPQCQSVSRMSENNKIIFSTPEEAYYEGYAPCRNCKP